MQRHMVLVTHGRAGSTMLQHALNQSPGVLVRGENYNLAFGLYLTYDAARRARVICPGDRASDTPWFGAPNLRVDELLERQRRMLVDCVLRPEAGTNLLGWKEIRHVPESPDIAGHERLLPRSFDELVGYLVYLDELLPGIRYLVNIRDPGATSRSSWWRADPARSLEILTTARDWLTALPAALAGRLNRRAALLLEYERWSADPGSLREAWAFLGAPWNEEKMVGVFKRRVNQGA